MNTIYRATHNSDLTEGRGYNVTIGLFKNENDAVEACKPFGVMGVGTGDVYRTVVFESFDEFHTLTEIKVWGHRRDWAGRWGYGWVDNRDAPVNDPDYAEYVRLRDKFGGVK